MSDNGHTQYRVNDAAAAVSIAFTSDNWKDPINCLVASGMPLDFLLSHVEEVYDNVDQLHDIMSLSELVNYSMEAYNAFHGV